MPVKPSVETKIQQERKRKGWSVVKAAEACGMTASNYHDYERGLIKRPNPDRVSAIKRAYGKRMSHATVLEAVSINAGAYDV